MNIRLSTFVMSLFCAASIAYSFLFLLFEVSVFQRTTDIRDMSLVFLLISVIVALIGTFSKKGIKDLLNRAPPPYYLSQDSENMNESEIFTDMMMAKAAYPKTLVRKLKADDALKLGQEMYGTKDHYELVKRTEVNREEVLMSTHPVEAMERFLNAQIVRSTDDDEQEA